jgi:arginine utilization protein RocB
MRVLKEGYSVTVPERAYAYFNCFTATHAPARVMGQMKNIARRALEKTALQMDESYRLLSKNGYRGGEFVKPQARVFTLEELIAMAQVKFHGDFDAYLKEFTESIPKGDLRARGIALVDKIADLAMEEDPYIVCFFLPPWLPVRTDVTDCPQDKQVMEAVCAIKENAEKDYGVKMREIELFAGLCDLSYVGASVSDEDVSAFERNMPGFGAMYHIPMKEMQKLGMPVLNIGPSGADAHKRTERLNVHYSLELLPEILRMSVREISKKVH